MYNSISLFQINEFVKIQSLTELLSISRVAGERNLNLTADLNEVYLFMLKVKKWHYVLVFFAIVLMSVLIWLYIPACNTSNNKIVGLKHTAVKSHYDLVVVGGEPEGIAAAVSGARNGLQTLLVDPSPVLGGLMTQGWLNSIDMNYGPDHQVLNKGIFQEFYSQVEGQSFDVTTATNVFNKMINEESNLDVAMNAAGIEPVISEVKGQRIITGINVKLGHNIKEIKAKRVIDATQDADLAAAAGVPYSYGQADFGHANKLMAVTQIFRLKGISKADWLKLMIYLDTRLGQHSGATMSSAWGFGNMMMGFKSSISQVGMRGLNLGRQNDGTVLVNAMQIYGIDGLKTSDRARARALAEQEMPQVIDYIRKHIPGLGNVQFDGLAPELYVRETRHIYGMYRLTIDDVLENRYFPDRIAFGSYPVDIQATGPDFNGNVIGAPKQYAIPFRCIVPLKVENLLVVGRSASFDSLASGSARTIPVGMATGQAAGAAAAVSIKFNKTFTAMAGDSQLIALLQNKLSSQGMDIKPFHIDTPIMHNWAYNGLKFMRHYGLASGGYSNDYHLDQEMSEVQFINDLYWAVKLSQAKVQAMPALYSEGTGLTLDKVSYMLAQYQGLNLSKEQALDYFNQRHFWSQKVLDNIKSHKGKINTGTAYEIINDFVHMVGTKQPLQVRQP